MNPWEVVAAKLDRFFFGHDHDGIVDGAEQLAEAEETEEVWLGNDHNEKCRNCGHIAWYHKGYCSAGVGGGEVCCCDEFVQHSTSSTDSRRTASVGDGPAPLDDPPVAGLAHSNLELAAADFIRQMSQLAELFDMKVDPLLTVTATVMREFADLIDPPK